MQKAALISAGMEMKLCLNHTPHPATRRMRRSREWRMRSRKISMSAQEFEASVFVGRTRAVCRPPRWGGVCTP